MVSQAKKIKRKLKKALKKTGQIAGKAKPFLNQQQIENAIMKIGANAGARMGSRKAGTFVASQLLRVPKLLGSGDYEVRSNSLVKHSGMLAEDHQPLKFFNQGRGVRITEREFVANVWGNVAFTNVTYPLTPTDPSTFPWLSTIAAQFDQWEPNGIMFEYKSTFSDYSAAGSMGTIIMSTDYDSTDPPYSNKIEAENSDYAVSFKPSVNAVAGIECSVSERPVKVLYTGFPPVGRDPNLFSLGNFQLLTQGLPSEPALCGELWVTYDITFYKKQIGNPSKTADYSWTGMTGQAPTKLWGTLAEPTPTYQWENGLSLSVLPNSNDVYLPNVPGTYMFVLGFKGSGLTAITFTPTYCTVVSNTNSANEGTAQTKIIIVKYDPTGSYAANTPKIAISVTGTTITTFTMNCNMIQNGQLYN